MRRWLPAGALVLLWASGAPAETVLGAPVFDTAAETTHREIAWDDFKSRSQGRDVTRWGDWILIVTPLRLGGYEIARRRDDGGEWIAEPVGLRPYAVMDKLLSGASRGARTRDALAHQQRLFDLAEAMARRLAVELKGVSGRGEVPYDAEENLRYRIRDAFMAARTELAELQQLYNSETAGDVNRRAKEREWTRRIADMLAEATADLEAVLADDL